MNGISNVGWHSDTASNAFAGKGPLCICTVSQCPTFGPSLLIILTSRSPSLSIYILTLLFATECVKTSHHPSRRKQVAAIEDADGDFGELGEAAGGLSELSGSELSGSELSDAEFTMPCMTSLEELMPCSVSDTSSEGSRSCCAAAGYHMDAPSDD